MQVNFLWFDPADKPIEAKISEAAARYAEKFGRAADRAYVNRHAIDHDLTIDGIVVTADRHILTNHIWMGCEVEKSVIFQPDATKEKVNGR